jgi:hypothetical protein
MYYFIAIAMLTLYAGHIEARDTWEVPVKTFDALKVDTAIDAEVVCGNESKVVVETSENTFDRLDIRVRGGELEIERDLHMGSFFGDHHDSVFVTVYTTGALDQLQAYTAGAIDVDSCAVAEDELRVHVSTGASISVSGETRNLRLKVSTGGDFNTHRNRSDLKVARANIKLSTGASAGLCAAELIEGKLSTGANVYASSNAEVDVRLGTGADVSYSRCRSD